MGPFGSICTLSEINGIKKIINMMKQNHQDVFHHINDFVFLRPPFQESQNGGDSLLLFPTSLRYNNDMVKHNFMTSSCVSSLID